MAKRVGVVLSGCGPRDGSEIREAVLTALAVERGGGRATFLAPDLQAAVVDHRTGQPTGERRAVLAEAARIARGRVYDIAETKLEQIDALIFPGGSGVGTVLSNYAEKGALCDVHPEVVRLLKGCLAARKPMGFICLAPVLAARVLGPVAGVRVTFGPRGSTVDKHAAVMGADVRPCPSAREVITDEKARVLSTPAYMIDDARLPDVAIGIEKLVRAVLAFARGQPQQPPPRRPAVTPGRGSA